MDRTGVRLLIVDDDGELSQTLVSRFQRLGMTVATVDTVAAALALVESKTFDVALLDYHLPDGTGSFWSSSRSSSRSWRPSC
jgi:two-component system aerobic respiration control sensor histidine kinase ArcB